MINKVVSIAIIPIILAGCQSQRYQNVDDLPPTAALPQTSQPGVVEVLYWNDIPGNYVSTMVNLPTYPESPDETALLTELRAEEDRGDYYGALVRGYLIPPEDGTYRFFVSGDDQTEFWLSSSSAMTDAERIARVPGYSGAGVYTKYASQVSAPQELNRSKRYYFEIRYKEGRDADHFSVAWEGPGISQQVIDSTHIASLGASLYPEDEATRTAYGIGYRVGFLDGSENLSFNPAYPPTDSDQDGLYDNWETVHGLDPNNPSDSKADLDGDLLTAADEFLIGTAEGNADSDNDGIPDGAEFAYGLDPLNPADATRDIDEDGFTNIEEYQAGTNLNDAEDTPYQGPIYVPGFIGQYFEGTSFNRFVAARQDEAIDFFWRDGRILPELPADRASIRWSGLFTAPHTESSREYRFATYTDDGVRLYIDGELVISEWKPQRATRYTYTRSFEANETVKLSMEYYEGWGHATAQLKIEDVSTGNLIPANSSIKAPDPADLSTDDTDSDGIPDSWELRHGLDPWRPDGNKISNDVGLSNLEAYQAGLSPWTLEPVSTSYEAPSSVEPAPENGSTVNDGSVTLSWVAPLTRVDGSSIALSEIDTFRVLYGQSPGQLSQTETVNGGETSVEITGLEPGTWYFAMQVIDTNGLESPLSEVVEYVAE